MMKDEWWWVPHSHQEPCPTASSVTTLHRKTLFNPDVGVWGSCSAVQKCLFFGEGGGASEPNCVPALGLSAFFCSTSPAAGRRRWTGKRVWNTKSGFGVQVRGLGFAVWGWRFPGVLGFQGLGFRGLEFQIKGGEGRGSKKRPKVHKG